MLTADKASTIAQAGANRPANQKYSVADTTPRSLRFIRIIVIHGSVIQVGQIVIPPVTADWSHRLNINKQSTPPLYLILGQQGFDLEIKLEWRQRANS
jgi:hypothetical protein